MKKLMLASAVIMSFTGVAYAADPPDWIKEITPPKELPSAWQEFQAVYSDGALPEKTKELIGLGVAAQIPGAVDESILPGRSHFRFPAYSRR
jgi:alkylhydroperoxidase/carboxymuconolactone decarboxylase family protein YurZ